MIRFQRPSELPCYVGGLLRSLGAIERCVQVNALAATGHGDRLVADVTQDVTDQLCNPSTRGKVYAWAWIKIKNKTVGVLGLPVGSEPPLRHMDFKSG